MKLGKAIATILTAALLLASAAAQAAPVDPQDSPQQAARFVEALGSQAVALLGSHRAVAPAKREAALRTLIRGSFDLELTSQFVLGKLWTRASPEQRAEFQDLFAQYLLNSYVRHLGSFRPETLTILAAHPVGEQDVLVETSIESAEGLTKPVWRVRSEGSEHRIIDVAVDGVSLALTQRREFAAVANRHGVEGLLKLLREKLAEQARSAQRPAERDGAHVSLLASILASPNAGRIGILLALR